MVQLHIIRSCNHEGFAVTIRRFITFADQIQSPALLRLRQPKHVFTDLLCDADYLRLKIQQSAYFAIRYRSASDHKTNPVLNLIENRNIRHHATSFEVEMYLNTARIFLAIRVAATTSRASGKMVIRQ